MGVRVHKGCEGWLSTKTVIGEDDREPDTRVERRN